MSLDAPLADVTSRIAQLQAWLGLQPAGVLGGLSTSTSGTSTSTGTSGTAFDATLAQALGLSGSGTTDGSTQQAAVGQRAVALASSYTGVPYQWGGTDPAKGLDCSGLTQLVYRSLGVSLPRVAADQAKAGVAVPSLDQAQPGDLVFFGSPAHHVGIYAGNGTMVDAPHTGSSVGVHKISGYGPVSAIRRVAPATAGGAVTTSALPGSLLSAAGLSTTGGSASALAQAELLSAGGLSALSVLSPSATGSGDGSSTDPLAALSELSRLSTLTTLSSAAASSSSPSMSATTAATGATTGATSAGATSAGTGLTGPYAALFEAAGRRHGVDPALLSAVAKTESGYDPTAVSPAGACGLMQLMPSTARSLGVDASDPAQAADGAARLLSGLLKQFGGRTDLALAGFNAGAGAVQHYGGVPPYPETRTYVQRVMSNWEALR